MTTIATQGFRCSALTLLACALSACGPGHGPLVPPSSPEASVRSFMNAVRANSLSAMSEVWGSARGPARTYMSQAELEQRLSIIRSYLENEKFEILESQAASPVGTDGRRSVQVRLTRKGCEPVVPFTVVPYGGGWLVADIDINAAGNPQRRCAPPTPSGGTPGRPALLLSR